MIFEAVIPPPTQRTHPETGRRASDAETAVRVRLTLEAGEVLRLSQARALIEAGLPGPKNQANRRTAHVISGALWLTEGQQDRMVFAGDTYAVCLSGDLVLSGVGPAPVTIEFSNFGNAEAMKRSWQSLWRQAARRGR